MAEIIIRAATEADVPAILALVEASVRGLQTADYSATQIDASIGSAFGIDRQLIDDGTYFVGAAADAPERLMVCGGWSFRGTLCGSDALTERDARRLDPATEAAKIRAIFVHPEYARRGLGSAILAHCERVATQAGFRRFEMGSTLTGVRLYALRGYVETGRLNLRLPNGEPLEVVRMEKSLSESEMA